MTKERSSPADLVQALRRHGARAFALPGIAMVALVPGEVIPPDLRNTVQAQAALLLTYLRTQGGAELEDRVALDDMNGARITWI